MVKKKTTGAMGTEIWKDQIYDFGCPSQVKKMSMKLRR